jgi:pyruvate kinase
MQVCAAKQEELRKKGAAVVPHWACLLDTKGPEIRTAMLRGGKDIELVAGQSIIVEAVGAEYTTWEGFKDEATGETHIGLSYDKLCSSVQAGNKILLADGSISIQVEEILSSRQLRGTVLNSKKLGQRKNGNLPGVKVDIPVLTDKDIDDLKNFCAKYDMDFVAASFVQASPRGHLHVCRGHPHRIDCCSAANASWRTRMQLTHPHAWLCAAERRRRAVHPPHPG